MSQYNVFIIIIVYLVLKAKTLFDKFSHYKKPLLLLCKFMFSWRPMCMNTFSVSTLFSQKNTLI